MLGRATASDADEEDATDGHASQSMSVGNVVPSAAPNPDVPLYNSTAARARRSKELRDRTLAAVRLRTTNRIPPKRICPVPKEPGHLPASRQWPPTRRRHGASGSTVAAMPLIRWVPPSIHWPRLRLGGSCRLRRHTKRRTEAGNCVAGVVPGLCGMTSSAPSWRLTPHSYSNLTPLRLLNPQSPRQQGRGWAVLL